MTTPDDSPPPSSRPPPSDPAPRVISLAARRPRAPARSPTEQILQTLLASVAPPPGTIANEIRFEPQPDWSALRTRLEQQDLDTAIALEEGTVARGERDTVRLRALRSLRAMRSFERGDRGRAFHEWQALFDEAPRDTSPLMTRAVFFRGIRDFDTVLADYDLAAAIQPDDPEIYEGRGLCFVLRSDWERALLEHQRLVHLRPRDRKALDSLASSLRFSGDLDGAIRVLGRALKLFPWRAELYLQRAGCYRSKGARAEELVDLDQCLARDPKNAEALRERASVHDHFKDEDRQFADLTRAIELDPSHAGTFQSRAFLHEKRGQLECAIADFSQAITLSPTTDVFLTSRAELYLKTGALSLALADVTLALDLEGRPQADTLWLRGHVHRKLGDPTSARADYRKAMRIDHELFRELARSESWKRTYKPLEAEHRDELDTLLVIVPEDSEYWAIRAGIFAAAGEPEKALADFDQAIALNPIWSDHFHARAMVLVKLGERTKAIEDESRAITRWPWEALPYAWRGTLRLSEEGPSAEAEADVRRAVELAPDDVVMLQLLADYLAETGRHEEALGVHDQRLVFYPDYGFLYAYRGAARLQLPHNEATLRAALADFDQAIALDGDKAKVFKQRAEVHALLGDEDAALRDLETLILLAPEVPEYFVLRARIFEAAGEHEKALADLDQALARAPDRSDFVEARERVLVARARSLET